MINRHISKIVLTTSLLCTAAFAVQSEVVVVVHPSNAATLDAKDVKKLFLGKTQKFPSGDPATPINQASTSPARESFDSETLGRSSSQVTAYWSKLVFTGKGVPPKELGDDAAVIAAVAADPSAVGYANSSAVDASVKAIPIN